MRTNLIEEIAKEARQLSNEDYAKFIEYLQKQIAQDRQKKVEKKIQKKKPKKSK